MVLPSLQQHFGFSTLRHGQAEVIERILAGLLPWQGQGHAKCVEGVGIHGGSTDVSKC